MLLLARVICRMRSVGVPKHFFDHAFQVRKLFTLFKIGQPVRADDTIDFRPRPLVHFGVEDHGEHECLQRRHRLQAKKSAKNHPRDSGKRTVSEPAENAELACECGHVKRGALTGINDTSRPFDVFLMLRRQGAFGESFLDQGCRQ